MKLCRSTRLVSLKNVADIECMSHHWKAFILLPSYSWLPCCTKITLGQLSAGCFILAYVWPPGNKLIPPPCHEHMEMSKVHFQNAGSFSLRRVFRILSLWLWHWTYHFKALRSSKQNTTISSYYLETTQSYSIHTSISYCCLLRDAYETHITLWKNADFLTLKHTIHLLNAGV